MPPKDVLLLIIRICEYVLFCGKRDFAHVLRLKIWRWEDYAGLSRWDPCIYNGPYKKEVGVSVFEYMTIKAEVRKREKEI